MNKQVTVSINKENMTKTVITKYTFGNGALRDNAEKKLSGVKKHKPLINPVIPISIRMKWMLFTTYIYSLFHKKTFYSEIVYETEESIDSLMPSFPEGI